MTEETDAAPQALSSPASEEVEATWSIVLYIWWAVMWRMLVGIICCALVLMPTESLFFTDPAYQNAKNGIFLLLVLFLSIRATRAVINSDFGFYRLALHRRPELAAPATGPNTEMAEKQRDS